MIQGETDQGIKNIRYTLKDLMKTGIKKNNHYIVSLSKDNSFFILNSDGKIVKQQELLYAVKTEIDLLGIGHQTGVFNFQFHLVEDSTILHMASHRHKYIKTAFHSDIKKEYKLWPLLSKYYQIAESQYKCTICHRKYKSRVIIEL